MEDIQVVPDVEANAAVDQIAESIGIENNGADLTKAVVTDTPEPEQANPAVPEQADAAPSAADLDAVAADQSAAAQTAPPMKTATISEAAANALGMSIDDDGTTHAFPPQPVDPVAAHIERLSRGTTHDRLMATLIVPYVEQ